ncbi:hypothetical protein OSG_eHP4_00100 [environmental Halophage eHP-4]|nr:hypothetical protein OSG_eHP4_00100 [environmental Halophage eHP-4]
MSFLNSAGLFDAIPDTGDYQWWIDAGSGSTLDANLGNVTASTVNSPSWTGSGFSGDSLQHDGVNQYWVTDTSLDVTTSTLCGWIKPEEYTNRGQFAAWGNGVLNGGKNGYFVAGAGDGVAALEMITGNGSSRSTEIQSVNFVPTGEWGFFAAIIDSSGNVRLITYSKTQELGDSGSVSMAEPPNESNPIYGGGHPDDDHAQCETTFFAAKAGATLSKTQIDELWNATKDFSTGGGV